MTSDFLSIDNVSKSFGPSIKALSGISLTVKRGECLAVVGESGSGKSTLANIILGIFGPTEGKVFLDGQPMPHIRKLEHRRRIQLVQQNPLSALNPRRTVGASLRLALDVHHIGEASTRNAQVSALLTQVGLDPALAQRLPASLSGGQRQRVAIARALASKADLIVLDEPTSALDVLVQARVLRLLNQLRAELGLTYVFITHDLSVVRNIADRVAVFEKGLLIETGSTERIFSHPSAAYTRQLIGAVPVIGADELALREKLRLNETPA
jgi:oligopeptide transport system ATP-binding protein